jgi:hypothetical protein
LTHHVYGLLHSYAHMVLRQMSLLSGFDQNSLREHLIPKALSFIIYHNNRQGFNMGGMFTLFEHRFPDMFPRITTFGDQCVSDPVCKTIRWACHSCIHIAEYSCQHYNRNLNRNPLYGGAWLDRHNITLQDFWSSSCFLVIRSLFIHRDPFGSAASSLVSKRVYDPLNNSNVL